MVNVDNFNNDYDTGHKVEIEVLNFVKKKYPLAKLMTGNFPDYDIIIPEINESIEVKYDKKAAKTENLFFETFFQAPNDTEKRPAGINRTKATQWFQVDDTYYYMMPIENLKYLIKEGLEDHSVREIKAPTGKDGTQVWGYISPRMHFENSPYVTTKKRPK